MGLVRTINTLEVTDFYQYGSYESWPKTLPERHLTKGFDGWLARFLPAGTKVQFGDMPEFLPGWNLP